MGDELLSFYQKSVKKSWKIAFLSAVIIGFLVHTYKFTNNFPYFDSFYNFYSSQYMVASGRWFLSAACALSTYFDLPWLVGIFSVLFMSLAAVTVTEVFRMENPCLIVVSSALLVSFPAITETMFFEYTADGYMLAMFLAGLSVCCSRMEYLGNWKHLGISAICLCLTCGIYQCYLAFAFILAVCYFVGKLLDGETDNKTCLRWVGVQAMLYLTALVLYYVIWKGLLKYHGLSAVAYQGLDQMGVLNGDHLLRAVLSSITSFVGFLMERNPLQHGWTVYSALSCMTCVVFVLMFLRGCLKGKLYQRKLQLFLSVLCLTAVPFGCYICYFSTPNVTYTTRMVQCIVVLFIFTGVLCQRWITNRGKNLVLFLLVAVALKNSLMANVCYTFLDRSFEQSYANMTEIATRIHMEDDGSAKYIVFLGSFDVPFQDGELDNSQLGTLGPLKLVSKAPVIDHDHMALFLSQYTGFTLSYYRIHQEEFPLMEISDADPVPQGYTFRFPLLGEEGKIALQSSEEVASMGIWPAGDSVKCIGDTIVVKLSEN